MLSGFSGAMPENFLIEIKPILAYANENALPEAD
jgi:hypothetical protein